MIPDWSIVLVAVLAAVSVLAAGSGWVVPAVVCALLLARGVLGHLWGVKLSWSVILAAVVAMGVVGLRTTQDLSGLEEPVPTSVVGVAELADDPTVGKFGTRATMLVEGRRWVADVPRESEHSLRGALMGERFFVEARAVEFDQSSHSGYESWARSQHLSGRLKVRSVRPVGNAPPWFAAANWFHRTLSAGASSMDRDQRSLYLGLVVGDDRGQSELTKHRFRVSGLAHLLAVSGQNVAFLFAVLSPLSSRVSFRWRWVLGITAICAFVVVTRAEPSVLRAAVMAVLALSATASGRSVSSVRLVALTVVMLLVADPLLVYSVGFQLSVGATAGLVLFTSRLIDVLPGPQFLVRPTAVTLAAQAGAILPMTAAFGVTSVVAVPANLLAEPAAAAVMTLGLSSGLLAGLVREPISSVMQIPVEVMVDWIDSVATVSSQMSISPLSITGWIALGSALAASVALWRQLGSEGIGRVTVLAATAMTLLLRPATLSEPVRLSGATVQQDLCARRVTLHESVNAHLLQELWRHGIARVDTVDVTSPSSMGGADEIAEQLRAEVRVLATARGSPCNVTS